ncbi:MAG: TerB family tellurite resistance protein [Alphaproteobacteria bacterium]|nr:TerB family tellurite resistance protein [Alphaproteobacteria bacterium]
MLDSLMRLLKRPPAFGRFGRAEIAAAALLAEAARTDAAILEDQRAGLTYLIRTRFMLSAPAADALVAVAEREPVEAYVPGTFADIVRELLDFEELHKIVRLIWRSLLADKAMARLDPGVMARLVEAIGLPANEADSARVEAKAAM